MKCNHKVGIIRERNTCMLPMRCAKRITPTMQMKLLNNTSLLKVFIARFCPYELQIIVVRTPH